MRNVEIVRIEKGPECIRGVMLVDSIIECCTLERPWEDNKKNVSAIPAGTYEAEPHNSPRFGNVFRVKDVPGRDDILIHSGNTVEETQGCVLVGETFGKLQGRRAVLSSRAAMNGLKDKLTGAFTLKIREI